MKFVSRAVALALTIAPSYAARSGSAVNASSAFVVNGNGSSRPLTTSTAATTNRSSDNLYHKMVDRKYPGTAVERMMNVRDRVKQIAGELDGEWEDVRRKILWAGGLKDLPNAVPGQGYTGHSFNDFNRKFKNICVGVLHSCFASFLTCDFLDQTSI